MPVPRSAGLVDAIPKTARSICSFVPKRIVGSTFPEIGTSAVRGSCAPRRCPGPILHRDHVAPQVALEFEVYTSSPRSRSRSRARPDASPSRYKWPFAPPRLPELLELTRIHLVSPRLSKTWITSDPRTLSDGRRLSRSSAQSCRGTSSSPWTFPRVVFHHHHHRPRWCTWRALPGGGGHQSRSSTRLPISRLLCCIPAVAAARGGVALLGRITLCRRAN